MRHLDARALAALAARAAAAGRTAAGASTTSPVPLSARWPLQTRPLSTIAHPSPTKRTTSLLPALESWRRAMHAAPAGQARGMAAAAAAQPLPATDEESDDEAASAHARRLRELQQHQQQPRRRQLDLSQVPMLDIKGAGGCSSKHDAPSASASAPVRAAPPPLDWREVVRRARAHEHHQNQNPLTDLHGRTHDYLRISLTERCNLRCSYCMPEEGVALTPSSHLLTPQEVQRLARLFVRAGVTKIRLTGGEPTVRRDLVEVVARLAELQEEGLRSIALTSNGVALERQLPRLRAAGLTHLNVSLDTLSPQRFERLTRRPADAHARVLGALDAALELGFGGAIGGAAETATTTTSSNNNSALPFSSAPFGSSTSSFASTSAAAPAGVKLNVVVVRGVNDDEVELFSALTRASPLNVRFIEYMPFDGNAWGKGKGMVPYAELRGRADLYAARTAAEEQAAAMAAAALPFPLPMAPAWPLAGGSAGLGLSSSSSSSARGGVMSFAAAAYHRLAGGGDAFWEKEQQQQQQQERRRRALQGPIARFAAEAGAALPLTPPSPPPPSSPQQQQQQHRPFTADAPLLALRRLDDHPSEVAKNFRAPGHAGTLSFVTSMTSHFCGGCSRLRLLADGALKVCLFGASEVSLRDAARGGATDDDLLAVVGAAVRRKKASHAGMHEIARTSNRPMITIGG